MMGLSNSNGALTSIPSTGPTTIGNSMKSSFFNGNANNANQIKKSKKNKKKDPSK